MAWLSPAQALPAWSYHHLGTTPTTVQTTLVATVYANIADPRAARQLARLTPADWRLLVRAYPTDLSAVIGEYAPASLAAYRTAKALQVLPPSTTIFDTMMNIYLDFLTNPALNLTPVQALVLAGRYMVGEATLAYMMGDAWGTELAALIQTYDPPLWEAMGNDIGYTVNVFGTGARFALNAIAESAPYLGASDGFTVYEGWDEYGDPATVILLNDGGNSSFAVGNSPSQSFDTSSPAAYVGGGKKHKD